MSEMDTKPQEELEFGRVSVTHEGPEERLIRQARPYPNTAFRRDTVEALRRSEERLRQIFEVGTVGIIVFDKEGVIVDANDTFLEKIGYSYNDLEAGTLSWRKLTPPQWVDVSERELQKLAETGHIGPYEKEYTRKDGSSCWFLFAGIALDEGGALEFMVDISDRKEAERELYKREYELSVLNETLQERVREQTAEVRALANELSLAEQKERDRIAQLLHDDLQQRLYALQLQFDFLITAHESNDRETFRRDAQAIEQELQDIVGTTRRLGADLSPPVLHNDGLAEAVVWLANHMQEQFGLDVTVQCEESFHVPDDSLRMLLFRSVRELLFNVVKHAGTPSARVRLQRENGHVCITVQDDGKGFDATDMQNGARAGMGLGMLRHRLQLVEAELKVESGPGAGTRVQVVAPLSH